MGRDGAQSKMEGTVSTPVDSLDVANLADFEEGLADSSEVYGEDAPVDGTYTDDGTMEDLYSDEGAETDGTEGLEFQYADSLDVSADPDDWYGEYEGEISEHVSTERMYRSDVVKVLSPKPASPYDSALYAVERKMSLRSEETPGRVVVERWLSPVNFRGYKFNLRKLLVYGIESRSDIHLYHYLGEFYFSIDDDFYALRETAVPREFESVQDTVLTQYLLTFVDNL